MAKSHGREFIIAGAATEAKRTHAADIVADTGLIAMIETGVCLHHGRLWLAVVRVMAHLRISMLMPIVGQDLERKTAIAQ